MLKKTFTINKELYLDSLLLQAVSEFEGFDISYSWGEITIIDDNPQYVFDEFINYVLSISLELSPWA